MKRPLLLLPLLALAAAGCATRQSVTSNSFGKPADEFLTASKSIRPGVELQMIRIAYAVDFGFHLTSDVFPADADTNDFAYVTVNHLDYENPNMSVSGIQLRKGNVASAPVVLETVVENSHLKEWRFRFRRGKDSIDEKGRQTMIPDNEQNLDVSFQDLFDSVTAWSTPAAATPSPAEETHAESAETAEPEPHAESVEGAENISVVSVDSVVSSTGRDSGKDPPTSGPSTDSTETTESTETDDR